MVGIYKITSPSKKVYIGQSVNIAERFRGYKNRSSKSQTILYNSFRKYGVKNHVFEILCECEITELNEKERYYQDLYSAMSSTGLNCRLTTTTDKTGYCCESTKLKIGAYSKVRKHTQETKDKISAKMTNRVMSEQTLIRMKEAQEKVVIDTKTGKCYRSAKEASDVFGITYSYLKSQLNGRFKNQTTLIYY